MKGAAGGRDSRWGSKDDHMMKDRDHRRGERENFDRTKLNKFISNTRRDKGSVGQVWQCGGGGGGLICVCVCVHACVCVRQNPCRHTFT